jgi:hypothetical protein
MKRMFFKQIAGILCCSGMLAAHAAKVAPVASWDAKPGDTALTYQRNGSKIEGRRILTEFRTFKQGKKNVHTAYFPEYKSSFETELPDSLWKKRGDFTVNGMLKLPSVDNYGPWDTPLIFKMQKVALCVNRRGNKGAKGQLSFNAYGKGGHRYIDSRVRVDDDKWHTFTVCVKNGKMMMWVDGKHIPKVPVFNKNTNPLPYSKKLKIGGGGKGLLISQLRFYDKALPKKKPLPQVLKEKITLPAGVQPMAELLAVKPVSKEMRLPFKRPSDAVRTNTLRLAAAPGEYEPVSFVIHAQTNLPDITIKTSDLKSKNGIINAKNVDVKLVKCWYQAGSAWVNIRNMPQVRILVPELLLNDDSLVKVDYTAQRNYVKLHLKDGIEYVEMTSPQGVGQPGMNNDQFPVKDSDKLLPFSIKKGRYKQIWVTVHVPQNCKAGVYDGNLKLISVGKTIGSFSLKLRVLPFKLAKPKTYYSLKDTFVSSIYYKGILAKKGTLTGWNKTEEQYRADLKNMLVHGVTAPMLHELEVKNDFKDFERALRIRKELGISNEPLYLLGRERNLKYENTTDPKKIAKAVAFLRKILAVTKKHGIKQVYIYGIDESRGSILKKQITIWKAFHKEGVKVYEAGYMGYHPTAFDLVGGHLDVLISWGHPKPAKEYSRLWHSKGGKIWCYGNPQGGVENPMAYRRGFGLPLWKVNYDGACTYVYNHGYGHTWNDFDSRLWRDHNLTYPTINGVIDTIAWEGYREAMDDVRYGTTLKEYIAKAEKSGNSRKKKLATEAQNWLRKVDVNKRDLDTVRLQIINWILKLHKGLK